MIRYGIVAHGGVGSPKANSDGCKIACEKGLAILQNKGDSLNAVIQAAVTLEDDGRFNAGSGSVIRLDGKTIQMDASLMDSRNNIGIVAGIEQVKNPTLVAKEVMKTSHVMLCQQGATNFAKKKGFYQQISPSKEAVSRFEKLKQSVDVKKFQENWNFDIPFEDLYGCDTIGAVAVDENGILAVANSTGGSNPMLYGRVGDSPIIGCGFFAGQSAAVATTGIGEEIIRKTIAKYVYDLISWGEDVQKACEIGVSLFKNDIHIGVIAISRRGFGIASSKEMACWSLIHDE